MSSLSIFGSDVVRYIDDDPSQIEMEEFELKGSFCKGIACSTRKLNKYAFTTVLMQKTRSNIECLICIVRHLDSPSNSISRIHNP